MNHFGQRKSTFTSGGTEVTGCELGRDNVTALAQPLHRAHSLGGVSTIADCWKVLASTGLLVAKDCLDIAKRPDFAVLMQRPTLSCLQVQY